MSTTAQRQFIVLEYWFRILVGSDISIEDIFKIILEFAKEYEKFTFIPSLSHDSLKLEDDGRILSKTSYNHHECSTFGSIITKPGNSYHWKIKVIKMGDDHLNIGIIEADKCELSLETGNKWFSTSYGYSYWAGNGKVYHSSSKNYGDAFGAGDVIDIWLDLRDNKNALSFAKNDKCYGLAATVQESTDYKLAVTMRRQQKKIELLSFEMI